MPAAQSKPAEEVVATPEVEAAPAPEKPKEEKLVEIELTTRFTTNGVHYGEEEKFDEEGLPIVQAVKVPESMSADLLRRQREYDRSMRERVNERKIGRFTA